MNVRCYVLEAKYEFLKHLRMPAYAIPSIIFPVMFYLLFGVMFGGARPAAGTTVGTYMMATYSTFGVIGAALFGFGVGIAVERGQGWMTLKRATPMPPLAYFLAKVAMAVLFGTIIIALIAATGVILAGVRLSSGQWVALSATLMAGAIPFCAIGLALGYFAGPNSSVAIVNLIFMPTAFASGLWIPFEMLPPVVKSIGDHKKPVKNQRTMVRTAQPTAVQPRGYSRPLQARGLHALTSPSGIHATNYQLELACLIRATSHTPRRSPRRRSTKRNAALPELPKRRTPSQARVPK